MESCELVLCNQTKQKLRKSFVAHATVIYNETFDEQMALLILCCTAQKIPHGFSLVETNRYPLEEDLVISQMLVKDRNWQNILFLALLEVLYLVARVLVRRASFQLIGPVVEGLELLLLAIYQFLPSLWCILEMVI